MLTVEDIKKVVSGTAFEFYGIRVDDGISYNVGDICENSHQWWQDSDTAEAYGLTDDDYNEDMQCWDSGELDGTCAIEFDANDDMSIQKALDQINMYGGRFIHVLGSDYVEGGNDIGEMIMGGAEVLGTYGK